MPFSPGSDPPPYPPKFTFPQVKAWVIAGRSTVLEAKASVYVLWRASGMTKAALAERLAVHEEARRVLDPDHAMGLDRLDAAARMFGHELALGAAAA